MYSLSIDKWMAKENFALNGKHSFLLKKLYKAIDHVIF